MEMAAGFGELDGRANKVQSEALKHHVDDDLRDVQQDECVRPAGRIAAIALKQGPAEDDGSDCRDERDDEADRVDGHGEGEVGADDGGFGVGEEIEVGA